MYQVAATAIKTTIIIDSASFPWDAVPRFGTPGGRNMLVRLNTDYGTGSVAVTLRGRNCQKIKAAVDAAPQGGTIIIHGKLIGDGKAITDAWMSFQSKDTAST